MSDFGIERCWVSREFLSIIDEDFCLDEEILGIRGIGREDSEDTRYQRICECKKEHHTDAEERELVARIGKCWEFLDESFGFFPHSLAPDILDQYYATITEYICLLASASRYYGRSSVDTTRESDDMEIDSDFSFYDFFARLAPDVWSETRELCEYIIPEDVLDIVIGEIDRGTDWDLASGDRVELVRSILVYCDIDELTTLLDEYAICPSDGRECQVFTL